MRKLALLFTTILILSTPTAAVFAQTLTTAVTPTVTVAPDKVSRLKAKAKQEIERRIGKLEAVLAKVGDAKKLSDQQKTELKTKISAMISDLKVLETKIDADTELSAILTDVKTLLTTYKDFKSLITDGAAMGYIDHLLKLADDMSVLADRISEVLAKEPSGDTKTTDELALSQARTLIQKAKDLIAKAQTDTEGSVKEQDLKDARLQLNNERALLQKIKISLNKERKDKENDGKKGKDATPSGTLRPTLAHEPEDRREAGEPTRKPLPSRPPRKAFPGPHDDKDKPPQSPPNAEPTETRNGL